MARTLEELHKQYKLIGQQIAEREKYDREIARKVEIKRGAALLKRIKDAGLFELSDEALIGIIEYSSNAVKTAPDYIEKLEAAGRGKGELIKKKQKTAQKPRKALADSEAYTAQEKTPSQPVCPQCGREMQRRTRRDGTGEFWGCKGYPQCKGIVSI